MVELPGVEPGCKEFRRKTYLDRQSWIFGDADKGRSENLQNLAQDFRPEAEQPSGLSL